MLQPATLSGCLGFRARAAGHAGARTRGGAAPEPRRACFRGLLQAAQPARPRGEPDESFLRMGTLAAATECGYCVVAAASGPASLCAKWISRALDPKIRNRRQLLHPTAIAQGVAKPKLPDPLPRRRVQTAIGCTRRCPGPQTHFHCRHSAAAPQARALEPRRSALPLLSPPPQRAARAEAVGGGREGIAKQPPRMSRPERPRGLADLAATGPHGSALWVALLLLGSAMGVVQPRPPRPPSPKLNRFETSMDGAATGRLGRRRAGWAEAAACRYSPIAPPRIAITTACMRPLLPQQPLGPDCRANASSKQAMCACLATPQALWAW